MPQLLFAPHFFKDSFTLEAEVSPTCEILHYFSCHFRHSKLDPNIYIFAHRKKVSFLIRKCDANEFFLCLVTPEAFYFEVVAELLWFPLIVGQEYL